MNRFILLILLIVISFSCNKGSDVIATTNKWTITRSEFEQWLQSRNISADKVYKDRYLSADYIKQIAVEKITAEKAESARFNSGKQYLTIEKAMYKNLLSSFYKEKISKELTFSEDAADISIIRFFYNVKSADSGLKESEKKRKLALDILNRLRSGDDFNELAGRYSEDAASKRKGQMGVLPYSLMEDEIKNAVSILNENEYTASPIVLGNSYCLIKLHKKFRINEKNINSIVTDNDRLDRILRFQKEKYVNGLLDLVSKGKNIITNIDKAEFIKSKEVIFSVDGEDFTFGELDDILNLFYSLKFGTMPEKDFSVKEKKITAKRIFMETLMAREAEKAHLDEKKDFVRNWLYLKRATLSGVYKYSVLMQMTTVTEGEIFKEYMENRTGRYSKTIEKNGRKIKVPVEVSRVRGAIKAFLGREKLKSLKQRWDSETLDEAGFIIRDKFFLIE